MTSPAAVALAAILVLFCYAGVVLPVRTEAKLAELRERIARDPVERYLFYVRYLVLTGCVVVVFTAVVAFGGEGLLAAGVGWPAGATVRLLPGLVAGLAVTNAVLGLAYLLGRRRDPKAFEKEVQYARIDFLVPRTRRELEIWPFVCLAIAVLEELLFRGLFVLYAAALAGISPWWLVVPACVAFGNGHRYQGWLGVVATTGIGLGLSALTVIVGSLFPAIVAHALFDFRLRFLKPPAPAAPSPG